MNVCFQTVTMLMLQGNVYTVIKKSQWEPSTFKIRLKALSHSLRLTPLYLNLIGILLHATNTNLISNLCVGHPVLPLVSSVLIEASAKPTDLSQCYTARWP